MDVDVEALRGAFAFVPLQQLVDGTVEQAQDDIRRLCAELSAASDADRYVQVALSGAQPM